MTTRVAGATLRPGPTNTLVDVPKIRVGHATLVGEGMLTGTHGGAHPARGGDWRRGRAGRRAGHQRDRPPGPQNLVERVHAVILTGGSAYGLATADGVMPTLAAAGRGFPVGPDPDIRTPGLAMDERRASWPAITALPLRARNARRTGVASVKRCEFLERKSC